VAITLLVGGTLSLTHPPDAPRTGREKGARERRTAAQPALPNEG